ncbi:MAG: hypothetical protein QUS14_02240 [Pyrinomonadaceae bacterium]|nr:hypothetical protein [Pyrinomonadaceae bacterium]
MDEEAAKPVPSEPGDLFYHYEIKTWEIGPRIYKILAASAIFNLLGLIIFAQADLLTRPGCESPFVGRVCQVLDTVYVGSVLLGTDREYIDAEYEKIDLGDAEITMIDVSNMEAPLSYPEGYFQIANPQQFAQMQAAANDPMMGFNSGMMPNPTVPGSDMFNTKPILPKANPNPVAGDLPDSPFKIEGDENPTTVANGGRKGRKGPLSNSNSKPDDTTTAGNTNSELPKADPTSPVAAVAINTRPMVDLGNYVLELRDDNLNLESEFVVNGRGKLDKEGKLDQNTFRFINASSTDERMVELVKESIAAINAAGYLKYLEQLSGKDLDLLFKQDAENLSALIQSEMESDTRAQAVKTIMQLGLDYTISKKQAPDADQNDKDDLELLKNAKIEVQGKKVVISFSVPKTVAHPMIQRKLAELAEQNKRPNGNAGFNQNDKSLAK